MPDNLELRHCERFSFLESQPFRLERRRLRPKTRFDCVANSGIPKIKYASRHQADANVTSEAFWNGVHSYQCRACGLWHVGRYPAKRRAA